MKYVFVPVFSARSNPDKNPKILLKDQIRHYLELDFEEEYPTYFISFTENLVKSRSNPQGQSKIGINPQFQYGNPIGVYCYPIRFVSSSVGKLTVPFASERPFIQVLKITADYNTSVLFNETYTRSTLNRDVKKLTAFFDRNIDLVKRNWEATVTRVSEVVDKPVEIELKNLDFNSTVKYCADMMLKKFKTLKLKSADIKRLWTYTHVMAYLFGRDSKPVVTWNKILRYLGYTVVIDSGTGYIHPNEPCQAVFLTNSSYDHVDQIKNKSRPPRQKLDFSEESAVRKMLGDSLVSYNRHNIFLKGDVLLRDLVLVNWPRNLQVDGSLNLQYSRLVKFSENINVTENLDISNTNLTSLGNVTVGRDLRISDTDIRKIDSVVSVGGSITSTDSTLVKQGDRVYCVYDLPQGLTLDHIMVSRLDQLTSLPDNLTVHTLHLKSLPNFHKLPKNLRAYNMEIVDLPITDLPGSLVVENNLAVRGDFLTSIPNGITVGGSLEIIDCPVFKHLPDNLTIPRHLHLTNSSRFSELPENLHVGGSLYIAGTSIKELPATLSVEGTIVTEDKLKVNKGAKYKRMVLV